MSTVICTCRLQLLFNELIRVFVGSRRNDYSGQTLSAVIGPGRGGDSGTRQAANGMAVFWAAEASQCWPLKPVIGTDTL